MFPANNELGRIQVSTGGGLTKGRVLAKADLLAVLAHEALGEGAVVLVEDSGDSSADSLHRPASQTPLTPGGGLSWEQNTLGKRGEKTVCDKSTIH